MVIKNYIYFDPKVAADHRFPASQPTSSGNPESMEGKTFIVLCPILHQAPSVFFRVKHFFLPLPSRGHSGGEMELRLFCAVNGDVRFTFIVITSQG